MANPAKLKGDRAELEAAALLTQLTGHSVRRKLGAGRADDTGDLDGLPDTVVQVANWADTAAAARRKPLGAEQQRINDNARWAVTMVRFPRAGFRIVMTPDQFAALYADALRGRDRP
jgi:hypothetical protein